MTATLALKAGPLTTHSKTEVDGKFTSLLNGAPDALNTLSELSAALGAGPNFSATILTSLSGKQSEFSTSVI